VRIDRRSVRSKLKPAQHWSAVLVLQGTLALGACKSQPVASRSDASVRRGIVKTDNEGMKFEPDAALAKTASDASHEAVKFAKQSYDVVLDWSDSSVSDLERLLETFYRQKLDAGADEKKVAQVGAVFGSYVGEVFRRNHGGQWGFITRDEERFPGMRANRSGQLFWPWGRVQHRLSNGPADNVADYYRLIVHDDVYK